MNLKSMAAIGLVVVAAGCSRTQNPVAPQSVVAETQNPVLDDPALGPQLAAVRGATAQFHDVAAAVAASAIAILSPRLARFLSAMSSMPGRPPERPW